MTDLLGRQTAPADAGVSQVGASPGDHRWLSRLRKGLEGLSDDLLDTTPDGGEQLYAELVSLHFFLIHAGLSESVKTGSSEPRQLVDWALEAKTGSVPLWPELRRWLLSRDLGWHAGTSNQLQLSSLEEHPLSNPSLHYLLVTSAECVATLVAKPYSLVEGVGALYQALLLFRLERQPAGAAQLRTGRNWICSKQLLKLAPNERLTLVKTRTRLTARALKTLSARLTEAQSQTEIQDALAPELLPGDGLKRSRWVVQSGSERRRAGAHYTPWELCSRLVELTLTPLLERLSAPRSTALLNLRICDPAMGAGIFLVACCRFLTQHLLDFWHREGRALSNNSELEARRLICRHVLHGVDLDPSAVSLARLSLFHFCKQPPELTEVLRASLQQGNAVVGRTHKAPGEPAPGKPPLPVSYFDWSRAYPGVLGGTVAGFDAIVGNPPWISYVGRATQPLAADISAHLRKHSPAFRRYRTLHGVFVHRSACLLRPGGRLGLLLPTSVADLEGYQPTRQAHDELCETDSLLPDWGDGAFEGVFQPTMALLSTRLRALPTASPPTTWPLQHPLTDPIEVALFERMTSLPLCPAKLFGERGYQTRPGDRLHMQRLAGPSAEFRLPLQEGADVIEFQSLPARTFANENGLIGKIRPEKDWHEVSVWIRQTSRFPIAALANGTGFRNSILAGFETPEYPAALLLVYLNSTLVRWYHYSQHRDARQGMPQLKIGHLRKLPDFPPHCPQRTSLIALGNRLGQRNSGLLQVERQELDNAIYNAFGLSAPERRALNKWRETFPAPRSRRKEIERELPNRSTPQYV